MPSSRSAGGPGRSRAGAEKRGLAWRSASGASRRAAACSRRARRRPWWRQGARASQRKKAPPGTPPRFHTPVAARRVLPLARKRCGRGASLCVPLMSRRREREPERVWVVPPAPELECSVCTEVFTDPVTLACGHTFCRQCAVDWFTTPRKLCPVARCPASAKTKPAQLPTAYALKGMIDALRVYCRYGLREDEGRWMPDPEGCLAAPAARGGCGARGGLRARLRGVPICRLRRGAAAARRRRARRGCGSGARARRARGAPCRARGNGGTLCRAGGTHQRTGGTLCCAGGTLGCCCFRGARHQRWRTSRSRCSRGDVPHDAERPC